MYIYLSSVGDICALKVSMATKPVLLTPSLYREKLTMCVYIYIFISTRVARRDSNLHRLLNINYFTLNVCTHKKITIDIIVFKYVLRER